MSAPLTRSQFAFELPQLSYIDTSREEPAAQPKADRVRRRGILTWFSARIAAFRAYRADLRARADLETMTDRDLADIGLNRADFDRMFDERRGGDFRPR
jgi:uncharacterized protein YjiS (DUF1127 family)